jgi:hypothetical protein
MFKPAFCVSAEAITLRPMPRPRQAWILAPSATGHRSGLADVASRNRCCRRTAADEFLRSEIGRKTADWGISVKSVEIRDVAIPVALQDAMSRQAQAEREKQPRVILGPAEAAIAGKFVDAALTYADNPAALQLRAMNSIYETTKERGATILIPTSMVDSMNPVVALALAGQETAPRKVSGPVPLESRSQ